MLRAVVDVGDCRSSVLVLTDMAADVVGSRWHLGAQYVLTNPLSSFGRGVKSQGRLAGDTDAMRAVPAVTARFADQLDVVRIRFPNDDLPLGGCDSGRLVYVFTGRQAVVCPYLVFAARTPASQCADTEFLAGNILGLTDRVSDALAPTTFTAASSPAEIRPVRRPPSIRTSLRSPHCAELCSMW